MIEYIKGTIEELTPVDAVIECNCIGYKILISLQTSQALEGKKNATVYIHHHIREDEEIFYGFASKDEREMFRLLISVSGVGAQTARMMLSAMSAEEIRMAILGEDVNKIKSVKGIGAKSAQRLILELKDKIGNGAGKESSTIFGSTTNTNIQEATTALVLLGFTKVNVTKAVELVIKEKPDASLEEIIKLALKRL